MADTTPDTSHIDRLAVATRYVTSEGTAKEGLLEVKEMTDKTGEGQATDILKSIKDSGLQTSNLSFQSYNFASNMTGVRNGAQALVSKKLEGTFHISHARLTGQTQ